MPRLQIESRKRVRDLSRDNRCYNGAYASNEWLWTNWDWLEWDVAPDKVEQRLAFWRDLNDYAVSQRGSSAKQEFRIREVNDG